MTPMSVTIQYCQNIQLKQINDETLRIYNIYSLKVFSEHNKLRNGILQEQIYNKFNSFFI